MNERISRLRKYSLNAVNSLSSERAELLTTFMKMPGTQQYSIPVQRAMAFSYILGNKKIYIHEGELIVGERGPAPKATPTYPEICLHSLEDLKILHERPKVSFASDDKMRDVYRDTIIPFWHGKTQRDRIFEKMDKEWINAYEAGVFTEFQEQRAPGHTVLGGKIYRKGMLDLQREIDETIAGLDFHNDPEAQGKNEELKAMKIAAEALIAYAIRHAEALDLLSEQDSDPIRRKELQEMASICRHVPAHAPRTFHEALQYYWFVHLGVITELNPWDSFNPGRLDQHLYPFFLEDIKQETLTEEKAKELLQAFWIKFNNHPAPPKIGVTAKESNTYTDFALINLGGLKEDGSNAVNELSYLILDVIREMRILQPSSMIQVSRENPDSFIRKAIGIIKTGFGQPSVFNTDAIIQELTLQGKSLTDARNGGVSGCVETGAFGTECYILTGYFNLTKILEITLHNGIDPLTGKRPGPETGDPSTFKTFEELFDAFNLQLKHFADIKIRGNNVIEQLFATYIPAPFLSLLIDDCIQNAKDYNAGGARYNTSYIQGVGLGTITDSFTAIRYHVYDRKALSLKEMIMATDRNFSDHPDLQKDLMFHAPKYGNDDDYADRHATMVFDSFHDAINGIPTPRGGTYRINMLPTTSHVYFGSKIGATPDGRKAGMPLSEGISPVQGADRKGPTAVLKSAVKFNHLKTGGTLLNQKFTPQLLSDEKGEQSLVHLIRSYFRMNGHHIQFNVVSAKTLKDAKKHPELYRDLVVRVAGYSDYFNDLTEELQDEIIRRTEHEGY
ncbi:MAG: glycyl radical protein [Bacteroidetes bacterium]|nr:glycyl radical protein [Bacteroidota bacterium]